MLIQSNPLSQPKRKAAAYLAAAFFSALYSISGFAQVPAGNFDPALADKGRKVYYVNCTKCHGLNMVTPGGGFFDLRTFPADEKPRFLESVNNGKRAMPAWKESLKADEVEALWSYVMSGKKK
jgi:mono/diheme cytochrome c family protein